VERRIRALFGNRKLFGVTDGSLVTHGELVTALGAAPGKHGAAVLRFHANPEPMSFGPLTVVRLKCTFRHWIAFGVPQRSGVARVHTPVVKVDREPSFSIGGSGRGVKRAPDQLLRVQRRPRLAAA